VRRNGPRALGGRNGRSHYKEEGRSQETKNPEEARIKRVSPKGEGRGKWKRGGAWRTKENGDDKGLGSRGNLDLMPGGDSPIPGQESLG